MRQRTLKPGFYKNEDMAARSPHARLLFGGLLLLADKAGRLEDRPARIRAEVFPYEPQVDVEACLVELTGAGFVVRYEVHGVRYLAIPTFLKHQHPHPKEPPSVIPEPPGETGKAAAGNGSSLIDSGETMADRAFSSGPSDYSGPSGSSEPSSHGAPCKATVPETEAPPTAATPAEARALAVARLGPRPAPEGWPTVEEYAQHVLAVYRERRGKPDLALSSVEFSLVRRWWEQRIPPRVIAQGLRECKGDGRTLMYYGGAVEDEAKRVSRARTL